MAFQVIEQHCRTVLNRVNTNVTPFRWSVNPYRGCQHACTYCYARRYHEFLNMNSGLDFSRKVIVKVNASDVLEQQLRHHTWRREMVSIGTAVDAYQPVEARYGITRQMLELFLHYKTPVTVVTKNTLILRDLALLQELSAGPGCTVYCSLSTVNSALARKLEPDAPPPLRRLEVMQKLVKNGVQAGILLAPILPGLTCALRRMEETVAAAAQHKAAFLHSAPLRLEGSVREVYMDFIRREFPVLESTYMHHYLGSRLPQHYQDKLAARIAFLCSKYHLPSDPAHGGQNSNSSSTSRRAYSPLNSITNTQLALAF